MNAISFRKLSNPLLGLFLILPVAAFADQHKGDMKGKADKKQHRLIHDAKSIGPPITGTELFDKDVVDNEGNEVGEVEELIVNRFGMVSHLIVSVGEFFDIDDELKPVPWEVFDLNEETFESPEDSPLMLSVSKRMLEDAPYIDTARITHVGTPATALDEADHYFEKQIMQRHKAWKDEMKMEKSKHGGKQSADM